ncbi:hypothetical protein A1O1_06348 [Capronia coronata CBS 617.96]|uniref:Uncharacterized protein n=1 Tax=Capronia coronata CBS 617.96 TaxID=1182541 RepID=W9YUM0_9EURO|nr:uncharacterized protein A1O1_06348 [Capronia coronata CBS 617.96]EXJ85979.1 hypothetical protein A1O1_06348 [Capronia coronata CBS 617.96]
MYSKTLLLSVILAEISATLATRNSHTSCSPLTPAARVTNRHVHGPFPIQQVLAYPSVRAGLLERNTGTDLVCFTANAGSCAEVLKFAHCLASRTSDGEACVINQGCTIQLIQCPPEAFPLKDNSGWMDKDGSSKDKAGPFNPEDQAGESPADSMLIARTPKEEQFVIPAAPAQPPKPELKKKSPIVIDIDQSNTIAEEVDSAMPDSVKEAMLNSDSDTAVQSLAQEFSGDTLPQ